MKELFTELAKTLIKNGERVSNEEGLTCTFSELTLAVSVNNGRRQPLALIFQLFGMDFILLSDGTVSFSAGEEASYMELQDAETLERIAGFLRWRKETLDSIGL